MITGISSFFRFFNQEITLVSGLAGSADPLNAFSTGANAFKADGDGYFDILVDLPPPPGSLANTVSGGDKISLLILNATESLFRDKSTGSDKGDGFYVAAHIQGIGPNADGSGWVTVPEPTTVVAGALLLLPFAASTIRFMRKNRAA